MNNPSKTYFISDLHLGAAYLDRPHDRERIIADFLDSIADDAREIYLVGDILDYWFEYRNVVPQGHVRFFGALARLADRGIKITWLIGNHDIWMFDYLRNELGIRIIDGSVTTEIDGRHFFISHGDGLGRQQASFRFIRSLFRNRTAQKLFAAIHPRWTVSFAYRWSRSNRNYNPALPPSYDGEIKASVENWAESYLKDHPDTDFIILGHHHVMVEKTIAPHTKLVVLGDWIYNYSYAVFDGKNLYLKQFDRAFREFNIFSQL